MRSRAPLFALLLLFGSLALPFIAHAAIPFFGRIIPKDPVGSVCPAGWGMLVTVINNIISLLITLAIVFVAPLMIAWSGFLFVVNPVNSGGISQAKGILWRTVIGIVVALAGWLIVDAVMAVFYHPSGEGWATSWSQIITSGGAPQCLEQAGALPGAGLTQAPPGGVAPPGGTLPTGLSTTPGDPCNPATIMGAVSASVSQANLLACIAKGESTCGTKNPPYNLNYSWNIAGPKGKASTAAGAYQVLLASNHSCYENKSCYAAVGLPAGGSTKLDCQKGFDPDGFIIPANSAVVETCKKAAGNVSCSAAAAVCLLNQQSFASAYGTDPYMSSCLSQYGP